jgi:hypothetical protein
MSPAFWVSAQSSLLITTQAAGLFLLVSTMLLIGLRRIYLDAKSKQPIEFEFPVLGKVKSQAPAFALVLVGAGMVLLPLSKMNPDEVTIEGQVDSGGRPIGMVIVPVPQYQQSFDASGPFQHALPLLQNCSGYRVKFLVDKQVIDDQAGDREERPGATQPGPVGGIRERPPGGPAPRQEGGVR